MKKIFFLLVISLPLIALSQIKSGLTVTDSTTINLGPDFNLCQGYIHLLDAGSGFDSYLWQDGSTSQTFMVTEGGTFWVHAFIGSTMVADTINIYYWPYPDPALGNDTLICFGNSLLLELPAGFASYQWMNGSTLPYFLVMQEGLYWVTVVDIHGCTGTDSIYVDFTSKSLDLGIDTSICDCDSVLLDAGEGYLSYEWQDGSTDRYFLVSGPVYGMGTHYFSVTVLDTNNCEYADTIKIYIDGIIDVAASNENNIRIYPNPADNYINLDLTGFQDDIGSITIFNLFGEPLYRCESVNSSPEHTFRLKVDHFNSGVYFLKIRSMNKEFTRKLLIKD